MSGKLNCRPDQLSRLGSTYEWMLHPRLFLMIDKYWGHIIGPRVEPLKNRASENNAWRAYGSLDLRCLGWTKNAATRAVSLADSTLRSYNGHVDKYVQFCKQKETDFSNEHSYSALSEFLSQSANLSQRPKLVLKSAKAAIACLFEVFGKTSPTHNTDIKRLVSGL